MLKTETQRWEYVKHVVECLQVESDRIDHVTDLVQINFESPLVEPFYIIADILVNTLSLIIEDNHDLLSWFIYENDYGRCEKSKVLEGEPTIIRNLNDLRYLIETTNKI